MEANTFAIIRWTLTNSNELNQQNAGKLEVRRCIPRVYEYRLYVLGASSWIFFWILIYTYLHSFLNFFLGGAFRRTSMNAGSSGMSPSTL